MRIEHRVTLIFSIMGILLGCISYLIGQATNIPEINILLLIVVGYGLKYVLQKIWKIEEKRGWWFKNGGTLFILLWLVVWTILYNI